MPVPDLWWQRGHRAIRTAARSWNAVALALAAVLLFLLAIQSRTLRAELEVERARSLRVGSLAPLVRTALLGGDSVELGRTRALGRVYFVYNTKCPYCARSVPAWNELYERFGSTSNVEILGIGLDSPQQTLSYYSKYGPKYESALLLDRRTRDVHGFGVVPQTIVMDSTGLVTYSRPGVLEARGAIDSVMAAIAVVAANADARRPP